MYKKSNTYIENLEAFQEQLLQNCMTSFPHLQTKKKSSLEKAILKASSQYVFEENKSLWGEEWFDDAYLAYFLFTQSARFYYTLWRTSPFFKFEDIERVVDFGSGPSTARLAFSAFSRDSHQLKWSNIDSSKTALQFGKRLEEAWGLKSDFVVSDKIPKPGSKTKYANELLILSFSNCEGLDLEESLNYQNILILEPGQLASSKKLISFRAKAFEHGFKALAPCPHQEDCPMREGKKNWCHDTAPKPKNINNFDLPFSQHRLNFSYLFLSKKDQGLKSSEKTARVIGDLRQEKGKTKVAVCRKSTPEFLSWLKKSKLELQLNRGDLIELPCKLTTKGQEVRIEDEIKTVF